MLMSELSEIEAVVARIRSEFHPELDGDFIAAVLRVEADAAGNDAAALQALRQAVNKALEASAT